MRRQKIHTDRIDTLSIFKSVKNYTFVIFIQKEWIVNNLKTSIKNFMVYNL